MFRSRLSLLTAALAVAGLATSASAQIQFTGGSGYAEATGGIVPFNGANALYQQTQNKPAIAATDSVTSSGSINALGVTHSSSATFNSVVNATSATISGTTAANRSGTATTLTGAFGLSAPNAPPQGSTPGAPSGYGYFTNFNITQAGLYNLNAAFNAGALATTTVGSATSGNYAYEDFQAYLLNTTTGQTYSIGAVNENSNGTLFADSGAGFPNSTPLGLGNNLLTLFPGSYQLYLQSQSYVQGQSGTQSAGASPSVSLSFVPGAAVPEPLSIAVFGGLAAVGGLAARRRMKATA